MVVTSAMDQERESLIPMELEQKLSKDEVLLWQIAEGIQVEPAYSINIAMHELAKNKGSFNIPYLWFTSEYQHFCAFKMSRLEI